MTTAKAPWRKERGEMITAEAQRRKERVKSKAALRYDSVL
jgi:hypothetical protein